MDFDVDANNNNPSTKADSAEVAEARRIARANFSFATSPPFTISDFVRDALKLNMENYLTRSSVQRDPTNSVIRRNGVDISVEYDFVHFKTDTIDEIHSRKALHHDIALGLYKQTTAERQIRDDGYIVLYAVGDAQVVLLIDYLRAKAPTYEVRYDPADAKVRERLEKGSTVGEMLIRRSLDLGKPYYIREITDERIVKAFEILTAPCVKLCVGEKIPIEKKMTETSSETKTQDTEATNETKESTEGPESKETKFEKDQKEAKEQKERREPTVKKGQEETKNPKSKKKKQPENEAPKEPEEPEEVEGEDYTVRPWQACAFFDEKIGDDGNLTFDTQVEYFPMPYDELPTQPMGFIRKENFKKVAKSTSTGKAEAEQQRQVGGRTVG